jgi:tetratricopeptide (TPR) repeat protein
MELIDGLSLDHVIGTLRQARRESQAPQANNLHENRFRPTPALEATGLYRPASDTRPIEGALSFHSDSHYFDTAARMVAEVAEALDYAHKNGVIHRDIKPSNLLLAPVGRLSISDFGLARVLEQPGMTLSGEFVGTPAYMSPEQIAVGRIPLDHRTDIYSLGATLYELLTLEPPFQGQTREQVLALIVHKEPKSLRRIDKKVPVDLETICLRCLEKDPDRRYQKAADLAEDLRRYVNRFAIKARRAGPVHQLAKWVRRRPAVAASLGGLLIALCLMLAFAYQSYRARLQLLDEKIRNAYLVASSGDLNRTDSAIKEIEELGASTGQVRLLRGVVAYFRLEVKLAVNELEQAVKLLPESVAARALLAMSYAETDLFDKYERSMVEMAELTPSSPQDYLFKGYAREQNEPGLGLTDLNEGIQRWDSPLGRALRTIARANRAVDSGRQQDVEAALADANAGRGMLPDNPLALYASVYASVVAAGFYQEAKLLQERTAVLQDAARDVQALEPYWELPDPAFATVSYFEEIGNRGAALDVARRTFDRRKDPTGAVVCSISLCQEGRFAEALKLLDQRREPDLRGDMMRAFVLAELPDEPRPARGEYQKFARMYSPENLPMRAKGVVLLYLGRREEALEEFRKASPEFALSVGWRGFYNAVHQFDCGELSEESLLATAGASRMKQCNAHYEIGLHRFALGDRAGARDDFQKAVGTRAIWLTSWMWSRMLLGRLVKGTEWPPWIPVKSSFTKQR